MTGRRQFLVAAGIASFIRVAGGAPSEDEDDAALGRDMDYAAGLAARKEGDHAVAARRFEAALVRFPEAADLHNELGFAYRKMGQLDKAFEHYRRALAINPRHRGAHEYIGETYLLVGDVAGAERHLAALRSICVVPCDELSELERTIAAYRPAPGR